jgi:ABC-type branched-subunit amino acid transport system ATPase component
MDQMKSWGIAIYTKERKDQQVLKDLLQLLRSQSPSKSASFAYIQAEDSLLPTLSLWENLQIVTGGTTWREFSQSVDEEWKPLINLITNPDQLTQSSMPWEKFTISLLKGLLASNQNLLIDMNEELLPPLMIQNFKKIFLKATDSRQIYLASAQTAVWLDCAHSIVSRKSFEFIVEKLDIERIKLHWAA